MFEIRQIPKAYIYIPGRAPVKSLTDKSVGNGSSICPKGAAVGELADVVIYGFVSSSTILEGRTYTTTDRVPVTRVLKELVILPIQQEFERTLAALSMTWGGKNIHLAVTEEGGITFSTKHTAVDEDGSREKKSELHCSCSPHCLSNFGSEAGLGGKFLAQTPKVIPRDVVHPSIQRRPREGTDPGMCNLSTLAYSALTSTQSRFSTLSSISWMKTARGRPLD